MSDDAGSPIVVDASVAVKWVLGEAFSDRALMLYGTGVRSGQPLLAPIILPNEVANAVYQQLRRGRITESEADAAVSRFSGYAVDLLSPPGLVEQAYAFAKRHQLGAIDDSLYVVLARELGADLWTDDRALLTRLAAAAPWVRWIGDHPPAGA